MKKGLIESELKLVDVVIGLFKSLYQGNDKAIKNDHLLFELAKLGHPTSGNTLRTVIGHIRRNDMLAPAYIVSDVSYGYWLTNDETEMRVFFDKMMNRMANQYQNMQHLHQRLKNNTKKIQDVQTHMFNT